MRPILFLLLATGPSLSHATCSDLAKPIELKDLAPTLVWDSKSKAFSFKEGEELPRITLSNVKFKEVPRTETLKRVRNGEMELDFGTLQIESAEGSWASPQSIFFNIEASRGSFTGMPSSVFLSLDSFTSTIRQDAAEVFILSSEMKRSSTSAYKVILKIKSTDVINIELQHPVFIERKTENERGRRQFDNLGTNETLCVQSWSDVSVRR